jgi:hypothetical protein
MAIGARAIVCATGIAKELERFMTDVRSTEQESLPEALRLYATGPYEKLLNSAADEIERLRAALESTRHKTPTGYNAWLDLTLGKK